MRTCGFDTQVHKLQLTNSTANIGCRSHGCQESLWLLKWLRKKKWRLGGGAPTLDPETHILTIFQILCGLYGPYIIVVQAMYGPYAPYIINIPQSIDRTVHIKATYRNIIYGPYGPYTRQHSRSLSRELQHI